MTQVPSKPTASNVYPEFEEISDASNWTASSPAQPASSGSRHSQAPHLKLLRWWQSISIRRKATVLAIALGVVPVLVVTGASEYFAIRALEANVRREQKARAIAVSQDVAGIAAERYQTVQALAQTPFLTDAQLRNETSTQQQQQYFEQFLTQGVNSIVVINAKTGDALVEARSPDQAATFPNFNDIDYFQAVIQTKQPAIAPVRRSKATNDLSFLAAAPVFDRQSGELLYVIRTRTSTSYISDRIQASIKARAELVGEDQKTNYYIADDEGEIFVSSNAEEIEQPLNKFFPTFTQLAEADRAEATRSRNAIDNEEYLLSYAPLKETAQLPDLDWGILVAEDSAIASAAQRQLLLALVLGLGLTAMVVSALATYLADRATYPILDAAEAVKKIGEGDLDARLEVGGRDEISALGTNINNMAAQLQTLLAAQTFEAAQERLLTTAKGSGVLGRAELQEIFNQAVEGARTLLNLDRVVIYRFEGDSGHGIVAESAAAGWPSALEEGVKDSCIPTELREAYRQGRVVATPDSAEAEWNPDYMQLMERLQVKANLVVPIVGSDRLYGLLIGHSCSKPHQWEEVEINLLKRLGSELALTIYRVELLEQTTNLAEEQRQIKEGLQMRALELLQEVDPISRGDLTTRAKVTADEIGTIADSYNVTVDNLRQIVLQVQDAANQVATTTYTNEASIQTLSAEALEQAKSISIALSLVQEMAEAVQTVAHSAAEAEMAVQQAAQTVEVGDETMNRTVVGIQGIRATVADTAKKVKHLGESSQKISKVVELISAFAAQTNMLALNASIEASRAGEEGRGFAVVANEVRGLARQSAEATEEIRSLISSIQSETNEVVAAMEAGIEQVVTGTKLVDETRQSLNNITAVSAQISKLVEAIAQSTVMQSQASEVVTQTMKDVAAIAEKTSTETSQVSSAFEQLQQVAQTLQKSVNQFKVS
ncbi:GAF domain-containing protein [Microcoleus sp. FACHB-1515]|uniref:methyl-accepting chemotaxis protein n=1 Tax=Cyanophyceae TaxID=3028117 RepID=UPI001683D6AB|nr:methyl-accepting chemotaxis protein [Microcoleus sp. FACHB-1515]MBD2092432.1 GAF domain-containing protein [Microcoleus sp. FACHB-1515]